MIDDSSGEAHSEAQKQRLRELASGVQERVQRTLDRETADHKLVRLSKLAGQRLG
ncbi:hypothetical protein [Sorangium sp. So ce1151]|uniref:hypothetical protein n=1 Tax=Sorangium sp. So ce1151 TaxID=3133332 RepID=UPI003F607239